MATDIAKVKEDNDVSAPNPKGALDSIDALVVVENPSDRVSKKALVDGPKDGEAKDVSPVANSDPVTDVQKKVKRAERFGMAVNLSEKEKRNSRAERFGSAVNCNETDAVKSSEDQKRKARAERFGISVETSDEEAKKKARLAKFTTVSKVDNVEDDKRKARALRFAQPSNGTVSSVNDKEKPEPNIAVESKAGDAA